MRKICLLALFAVLGAASPASGAADGSLFTSAPAPAGRSLDRHAVRERFVTVDPAVLLAADAGDGTVVFNLFDDVVLTGTSEAVQVRGPGDFTWVGGVGTAGSAVVSVQGGSMVGRIADPERGTFTITPAPGGVHAVAEVDPASYPPEAEPRQVLQREEAVERGAAAGDGVAGAVVVTVLVVYTADAAAALGGAATLEALAANVVAETNLAYGDSGVVHRLELAGTREVAYPESGDPDIDLQRVTQDGDGFMDEVHDWRNEAYADLVVLIVASMADSCGIAWYLPEADPWFEFRAFGVVAYDCALGNLSFAHETGHNFGADHERGVSDDGIYSYSHAYVDCVNGFRTIMAYGDGCPVRPPRVARYSGPDHPYGGFPSGDADTDNARTLNRTAPVVALFRSPPVECAGRQATIQGTDGAETLIGTPGPDVIHALGGDDIVYGGGGDDVICGGDGNDTIISDAGRDEVYGGPGNDTVRTGPEDDVVYGGGGADAIWTGTGDDAAYGGRGADAIWGGPGNDALNGQGDADEIHGGSGTDVLRGGPGDDRLFGDSDDPPLNGGTGEDSCSLSGGLPAPC